LYYFKFYLGYHSDDGGRYHGNGRQLSTFGPTFTIDDVVGCGVCNRTKSIFFTLNGKLLGNAFTDINEEIELFPSGNILLLFVYIKSFSFHFKNY
jgi:hypothetical protein